MQVSTNKGKLCFFQEIRSRQGAIYRVGQTLVVLPSYRDREEGGVEAAEYRVWARAPDHVRPVDGVYYDQVVTEHLESPPESKVHEALGERRPSGWLRAKEREGRGPARLTPQVAKASDCPSNCKERVP
ncbi:hypothetical protein GCM10010206_61820 [Streptomyces cinerochromogenes]|nr:hypothetical protein GCM10010206_61820 [Streptomyces cinerochromogenes]